MLTRQEKGPQRMPGQEEGPQRMAGHLPKDLQHHGWRTTGSFREAGRILLLCLVSLHVCHSYQLKHQTRRLIRHSSTLRLQGSCPGVIETTDNPLTVVFPPEDASVYPTPQKSASILMYIDRATLLGLNTGRQQSMALL